MCSDLSSALNYCDGSERTPLGSDKRTKRPIERTIGTRDCRRSPGTCRGCVHAQQRHKRQGKHNRQDWPLHGPELSADSRAFRFASL
jgi:hypothetical protein